MRNTIKGVLTAIVTPFDADGDLNLPGLTRQIARQLDAGNGIFCGGTNGEFFVLSEEEKLAVTRHCVETVAGRAPVVAHAGEISTRQTIRLGKQIASLGVDAVSVITPKARRANHALYGYCRCAERADLSLQYSSENR